MRESKGRALTFLPFGRHFREQLTASRAGTGDARTTQGARCLPGAQGSAGWGTAAARPLSEPPAVPQLHSPPRALRDPASKLTKENFTVHRETVGQHPNAGSGAPPRSRSPGEAPAHSYSSLRPPLLLPPPAPGSHLSSGSCRGSRPRGGGRAPPPPRSAAAPSAALPPAPGFIGGSGGRGKRRAEPLRGAPPPRAAPAAFPPPGRGERGVAPRGGERKGWGG